MCEPAFAIRHKRLRSFRRTTDPPAFPGFANPDSRFENNGKTLIRNPYSATFIDQLRRYC
jgi:hypothetical protein